MSATTMFHYRTDKGNEFHSIESLEHARSMALAMDETGCINCVNCIRCKDCKDCRGCRECDNCRDCKFCIRMTDLLHASFAIA